MALFYKYAKALNEAHAIYKAGGSIEEVQKRYQEIIPADEAEKEKIKAAQEQLVIYSPFVDKELSKPEYDGKRISSLLFSMGLGTPEQLETYNKVLDECIKRYDISEPIKKEPGQIKIYEFTPEEKAEVEASNKILKEFNPENPGEEITSFIEMSEELLRKANKKDTLLSAPFAFPKNLNLPLDKLSLKIFNYHESTDGQLRFLSTGEDFGLMYALNIHEDENFKYSKELTPYDFLISDIVNSLSCYYIRNGQNKPIITINSIYKLMGGKGNVPSTTAKKIRDSIMKTRNTDLTINNEIAFDEKTREKKTSEKRGSKYITHAGYTARITPVNYIDVIYNGGHTDFAFVPYEVPFIITFAEERKQITEVPFSLLEVDTSKIRLTDTTISIRSYLLRVIAQIKNPKNKRSNYIKFLTILEDCKIKTDKHALRNWEKIEYFLNLFKEKGFIKDFKMHDYKLLSGSFEIIYDTDTKRIPQKKEGGTK